jgi:hypothetical protein
VRISTGSEKQYKRNKNTHTHTLIYLLPIPVVSRDSAVGIATSYGLDD